MNTSRRDFLKLAGGLYLGSLIRPYNLLSSPYELLKYPFKYSNPPVYQVPLMSGYYPLEYVKSPRRAEHEITSGRTPTGKLYSMPGKGKRFARIGQGPIHYQQERGVSPLLDIDTNIRTAGSSLRMDKALFDFDTFTTGVGFSHVSKGIGNIDINLISISVNGVETLVNDLNINPTFTGNIVQYNNLLPGIDIHFELFPGRTRVFKIVRSTVAVPVVFKWESAEGNLTNIKHTTRGVAFDNLEGFSRTGRSRLKAEILIGNRVSKGTRGGKSIFEITETVTGRTAINTSPENRVKVWQNTRLGTIRFNQDITESIVTALDDGQERAGNWEDVYPATNYHYIAETNQWFPGYRFQGIAVGNGDTIDAGTQLVITTGPNGSTNQTGTITADVGSTRQDAWSDTSAPSDMTDSTASTSAPFTANSTVFNFNVVAIMQELADLAGWASNDNCRFGIVTTSGAGNYRSIEDYATDVPNSADFEINFTASAAVTRRKVLF